MQITTSPAASLRRFLVSEGVYGMNAIADIVHYAMDAGHVDGAPRLDPLDSDAATDAYAAGFPDVLFDDPSWDADDGHWTPNDTIGLDVDDLVEVVPDAPDWYLTQRPGYPAELAADGIEITPSTLPAICGGCDPSIPAYGPTPEDWADYEAWSRTCDYLDGFNAVRPD